MTPYVLVFGAVALVLAAACVGVWWLACTVMGAADRDYEESEDRDE